jgi:NAD(P)-dependent dehydrogenase (short-subunit alcohol dehydrogenase family)
MTAYSAAKAGIDALVRSLACEMASRKIRVNSIVAGAVKTAMHDRLAQTNNDKAMTDYENNHLLGFGQINDVSNAAVFLLTPAASWITGTSLVVDGGYKVR